MTTATTATASKDITELGICNIRLDQRLEGNDDEEDFSQTTSPDP